MELVGVVFIGGLAREGMHMGMVSQEGMCMRWIGIRYHPRRCGCDITHGTGQSLACCQIIMGAHMCVYSIAAWNKCIQLGLGGLVGQRFGG